MVVSECSSEQLTCQKDNTVLIRIEKAIGICLWKSRMSGVQTFREVLCRAVFSLSGGLQKALSLVF